MNLNPDLVDLYRKHLHGEFGRHGTRTRVFRGREVTEAYDPWWWPVYPAAEPPHWGLNSSQKQQFASLSPTRPSKRRQHPGFGGSLTARQGCIFVVGERPSFNRYFADAVSSLFDCLFNFLSEEREFHVTDSIKFRGEDLTDRLNADMLRISAACLADEITLLQPSAVVFTSMTSRALRKLEGQTGFATSKDRLIDHPQKETVPFWSSTAFSDWQTAIKRLTK